MNTKVVSPLTVGFVTNANTPAAIVFGPFRPGDFVRRVRFAVTAESSALYTAAPLSAEIYLSSDRPNGSAAAQVSQARDGRRVQPAVDLYQTSTTLTDPTVPEGYVRTWDHILPVAARLGDHDFYVSVVVSQATYQTLGVVSLDLAPFEEPANGR